MMLYVRHQDGRFLIAEILDRQFLVQRPRTGTTKQFLAYHLILIMRGRALSFQQAR